MPVTDDRGVGPRPMAYRKWKRVIFCVDCPFETDSDPVAEAHRAMNPQHRLMVRKRHKVLND